MIYTDTGPLVAFYANENAALEAARFTERLNTRSFDILHVSIALELGCDTFHTFDPDQRRLAVAAGLRTNPIGKLS